MFMMDLDVGFLQNPMKLVEGDLPTSLRRCHSSLCDKNASASPSFLSIILKFLI